MKPPITGEKSLSATEPEANGWTRHELTLRIASAIVLAVLAIGLNWVGQLPFAGLVLCVTLVMSWEWGHIVREAAVDTSLVVHALAAGLATILAAFGQGVLALVALAMGALIVMPLSFGRSGLISAIGVVYVGLPSVVLVWLRGDESYGFAAVLFVLLSVWAMDTFALIGGRAIGGPRMWPAISPNKTWAGLVSGMVAGAMMGSLFATAIGAQWPQLAMLGLVLGGFSQCGDLAESALKRHYNVKDSSRLIPGHGGFLDRLDGLVAAAMLSGLLALLIDPDAPARGLLFGP